MTEERKERRFRMGTLDATELGHAIDTPQEWSSISDFTQWFMQTIEGEVEAILASSAFVPTRVLFSLRDYGYHGHSALDMYGWRPETDKEMAARIKKQSKRAKKLAAKVTVKEKRERAQLAKLKAKYPEDRDVE